MSDRKKPALHQIIAIGKGSQSRTLAALTEIHKANQKPELFQGVIRQFTPKTEDGEKYPDESKVVQRKAAGVLAEAQAVLSEQFDLTASRDFTNTVAKASVVVDGKTLVKDAPVTYLLFLEKQLTNTRTLITELPTLDPGQVWPTHDGGTGLWHSAENVTYKTKKVQKPLVLAPATDKHPAQCQMITDDEIVGSWKTTNLSGALSAAHKDAILAKLDKVIKAVKSAREEANSTEAIVIEGVGTAIFDYVLK